MGSVSPFHAYTPLYFYMCRLFFYPSVSSMSRDLRNIFITTAWKIYCNIILINWGLMELKFHGLLKILRTIIFIR
jgi:hypothetical protein